jgi:hypothetical protein
MSGEGVGQELRQSGEVAGRELDARVAREVMGLGDVREEVWGLDHHRDWRYPVWRDELRSVDGVIAAHWAWLRVPAYSTDIAAAFEVVEKMAERGYDFELFVAAHLGAVAIFRDYETPRDHPPEGRAVIDPREGAAPLAICRAALAALTPPTNSQPASTPARAAPGEENERPHE